MAPPLPGSCAAASGAEGRPPVLTVPAAALAGPRPQTLLQVPGLSRHISPLPRPSALSPCNPRDSHPSFDTFLDCLAHPLASSQDTSRLGGTPSPTPSGLGVCRWGRCLPVLHWCFQKPPQPPRRPLGTTPGTTRTLPRVVGLGSRSGSGAPAMPAIRCPPAPGPLCPAPSPLLCRKLQRS